MKKYLLFIAVLFCTDCLFAQLSRKVLPAEAKPFIPAGYEAAYFFKRDVNRDGKQDIILVLSDSREKEIDSIDFVRPLLLLVRGANNKLSLALRNDSMIMCKHCGGMMGDPYENTEVIKDTIVFYFNGGSRQRWSENYFFLYNKPSKNWKLVKLVKDGYDNLHPEQITPAIIIKQEELQGITLANVNTTRETAENKWKVASAKTFFYTTPDKKSKPRKAYLLKNDIVTSYGDETTNFIVVHFQNEKDQYTKGYVLKRDLQKQ